MITEIPSGAVVLMGGCCIALAFWIGLTVLWFVCPRVAEQQAVGWAVFVFYLLTPLFYAFGHAGLSSHLGGLPAWGKIEGEQYFLGRAGGAGYIEVSAAVYFFFVWFERIGFSSMLAMAGGALTVGWLRERRDRTATRTGAAGTS
jgi:hypothetical protein